MDSRLDQKRRSPNLGNSLVAGRQTAPATKGSGFQIPPLNLECFWRKKQGELLTMRLPSIFWKTAGKIIVFIFPKTQSGKKTIKDPENSLFFHEKTAVHQEL